MFLAGLLVAAPLLDSQGLGDDFQVNSSPVQCQFPDAAADVIGNFAVAWEGWHGVAEIYARRSIGDEFRVDQSPLFGVAKQPAVASDPSGNLVFVWSIGASIKGRRSATTVNTNDPANWCESEFVVSSNAAPSLGFAFPSPDVALDSTGAFLVAWVNETNSGHGRIDGLYYPAGGTFCEPLPTVSQFPISSEDHAKEKPAVATDGVGHFVVVWGSDAQDDFGWGVYGQRYTNGTPQGGEFRVAEATGVDQKYPAVAGAPSHFVVVWLQGANVVARMFDWSGSALTADITVGQSGDLPDVSMHPDGSFVVVWSKMVETGEEVFAQKYTALGVESGSVFTLNTTTNGFQRRPTVAAARNGFFVAGWTSEATTGELHPIHARRFGTARKGDLNGDGDTDLVLNQVDSTLHHEAWLMNEVTRFAPPIAITPDADVNWQLKGVDDFVGGVGAGDGANDLAFWNSTSGAVQFWKMGGPNGLDRQGNPLALSGAAALALDWKLSGTGDFNADSMPDIVWRNSVTQKLQIWTMNGTAKSGTIIPTPDQAVDANWDIVATLDYNNDGNRDFLWYNAASGKIVLWFMDANVVRITGGFTNPTNAGDNNWKVVAGGDYGVGSGGVAGSNDIVWRNQTSGKLVVWHMDFARNRTFGRFTAPDSPTPALGWTVVGPK